VDITGYMWFMIIIGSPCSPQAFFP